MVTQLTKCLADNHTVQHKKTAVIGMVKNEHFYRGNKQPKNKSEVLNNIIFFFSANVW